MYNVHYIFAEIIKVMLIYVSISIEILRALCLVNSVHWSFYAIVGILIPLMIDRVVFRRISNYIQHIKIIRKI